MTKAAFSAAQLGTDRWLFAIASLALMGVGCGVGEAKLSDAGGGILDASLDSSSGRGDTGVLTDAGHDATIALGECCPIDPHPGCCMKYGGVRTGASCGMACDGMPLPGDPRWKVGQDDHGCPIWIEPEVIGNECCGCAPSHCVQEIGFLERGTRIPLQTFCDERGCPSDMESAIENVRAHPSPSFGACTDLLISGCGVDTVTQHWGTHAAAFHFSTTSGLLIGAEYLDDVGFAQGGCFDADFLAGQGRPECDAVTTQELCDSEDGGV
jgi:hypothetical protein